MLEENGHDLIEYTLLLAAVALAAGAMTVGIGGTLDSIWSIFNNRFAGS
jgi:Flp pilus assembly pilin Flp